MDSTQQEGSLTLLEQGLETSVLYLEQCKVWTHLERQTHIYLSLLLIRNPGLGGNGPSSLRGRLLALGTKSLSKE